MHQISLLLWSWIETIRNFGRWRLWGPFLVLWAVQAGSILLLTQFYQPLLAPVLVPVLRLVGRILGPLGGDPILHYPFFYLALPSVFTVVALFLDLFVGSWTLAVAFLLFWQADRPAEPFQGAFGRAARVYTRLVLARLPLVLLLVLLLFGLPRMLLGGASDLPGSTLRTIRYGSVLIGSILEGLFLFAPLAILVEGKGVGGALRRSLALAGRIPLATLGAVLIPNLIQIPVSAVFRRSDVIVQRLTPEVMVWVLLGTALLYAVSAFFMVGAGARLFRFHAEETRH
jgi:hypothetical protein